MLTRLLRTQARLEVELRRRVERCFVHCVVTDTCGIPIVASDLRVLPNKPIKALLQRVHTLYHSKQSFVRPASVRYSVGEERADGGGRRLPVLRGYYHNCVESVHYQS